MLREKEREDRMNRGMPCEERRERDEWRRKRKRCV
jgi:hypothetical protein